MMRVRSLLRMPGLWRVGLIALGVLFCLIAGASPSVHQSLLSPLIVGAIVAAMGVSIALLRKPVWALYAAIFVVFLPSVRGQTALAQTLDRMQSFLNRGVTLIALISWLLNLITRRDRIVWTGPALLMLGFLLWGTITLSWAPDLSRGIEKVGQYTLRFILYMVLIANEINTKEALDKLMRILALNSWLLVLAGIGAVLLQGYDPGTRLTVLGMDENEFGIRVLGTMPGVLWQVMQSSDRQRALRMVSSFAFLALAVVLIVLTGSRGSAISLLGTTLVFWFWRPTRTWGNLGLLILAVGLIGAPFVFTTIIQRFVEVEGGPLGGRLLIWRASWQIIESHPWGGVGIGNAGRALSAYLRGITPIFRHRQEMVSHNALLQVWTETGTPGMLLYLGVLFSAVWSFVWQYGQYSKARARSLTPYFALVSSVFVGIMFWWIKGGGAAYDPSYFLLLAFLLMPSCLDIEGMTHLAEGDIRDARREERWTRDTAPQPRSL